MERIYKQSAVAVMVIAVLVCCCVCTGAETSSKAELQLKEVSLFKNGLGFFVSEAEIPKKAESFYIVPQAAPVHGTFWVSYPEKVKVEMLAAREEQTDEEVEVTNILELLAANVGKKVRLIISDEEKIEGVIEQFVIEEPKEPANPYSPGSVPPGQTRRMGGYVSMPELVIVKTKEGEAAIRAGNIRRIDFVDEKATRTRVNKLKEYRLDVNLAKGSGRGTIGVSYLAKGVTWAPSYIIDVTEPEEAKMSAKAEVLNEICDFDGVDLQLVTGFPNVQFSDVVSPLALKENLAGFLQALSSGQSVRGRAAGRMENVMRQSVMYQAEAMDASGVLMPAYGAAEAGKVAEDLFLYPVRDVTLCKGCVGYVPLFTETVPYKHIYQWQIPNYLDEYERYRSDVRPGEKDEQVVWHCIRLENNTKVPWTTAPAEIVKENTILGQDILSYTPAKAKSTVRITRAVGVKAEEAEFEQERKRDAAQMYGYHYDLVTIDGKLSLSNFQEKAITLEITKILSGELKSAELEPKADKLARGLRIMNTVLKLTWTIELGAGEQKEISYTYDVYIRR